jgi:hypothetical protein
MRKYKLPLRVLKTGVYTTTEKYTPILLKYALTTLLRLLEDELKCGKHLYPHASMRLLQPDYRISRPVRYAM